MNITIISPGMECDGSTLKVKSLGGSETAAIQLAEAFARKKDPFGNKNRVLVFSNCKAPIVVSNVQYLPLSALQEYLAGTSTDVLIMSRWMEPLMKPNHAKVTLLWCHDLALKRTSAQLRGVMYQIDKLLVMSQFQKEQYKSVYEISDDLLHLTRNGIDLSMFPAPFSMPRNKGQMVYCARPERGLENLVKPGGIMERFLERKIPVTLYVAYYDNTVEQMKGYYEMLWNRCNQLPNVQLLGSLTKTQLYDLYSRSWAYIYPTEFEEISCISAMEAQACGLPMITAPVAALVETLHPDSRIFIEGKATEADTHDKFVAEVAVLLDNDDEWLKMSNAGYAHSATLGWDAVADNLVNLADKIMEKKTSDPARLYKHFFMMSDIDMCREIESKTFDSKFLNLTKKERAYIHNGFDFTSSPEAYREQYRKVDEGATVEHYDHSGNEPRLLALLGFVQANKVKFKKVLDYGCWIGHQTTRVANELGPDVQVVGIDVTQRNIDLANECKAKHSLHGNVEFLIKDEMGDGLSVPGYGEYDLVICNEVLEHVLDPEYLIGLLEGMCKPGGTIYINTPAGPWEYMSYYTFPYRCHIRHYEMNDLLEMFGEKDEVQLFYKYNSDAHNGLPVGHHYTIYTNNPDRKTGKINYARKMRWQNPRETLSVCMIAYNAEDMLHRCLKSVRDIADEIIIAIDPKTNDSTREIAEKYGAKIIEGVDPLKDGFEVARNHSKELALGDWILWIDSDEELLLPANLPKYMRGNGFDGYAIQQHHLSVDPPMSLKPDLPIRLFRNNKDIKFFGVCHEHPEKELNKGIGLAVVLVDTWIAHDGYLTENIRRRRFLRNIDLVKRDREKYPERSLGHFLWLRDLIHMFRYRLEQTNGTGPDPDCLGWAMEAKALFEEKFMNDPKSPMLIEAINYYSDANRLLNIGHDIEFSLNLQGQGPVSMKARFPDSDKAGEFFGKLTKSIISVVEGPYV